MIIYLTDSDAELVTNRFPPGKRPVSSQEYAAYAIELPLDLSEVAICLKYIHEFTSNQTAWTTCLWLQEFDNKNDLANTPSTIMKVENNHIFGDFQLFKSKFIF